MWVGSIRLDVTTKNADHAGTDSLVTATVVRDGEELYDLKLDYSDEDDLERGAVRAYWYHDVPRRNDETDELPPGIGQSPMPYPDHGVEFSHGMAGHLRLRLRVHGSDLWIKDSVTLRIRRVEQVANSFDTLVWEDQPWEFVGVWGKDVPLSGQWFPIEGYWEWDLKV